MIVAPDLIDADEWEIIHQAVAPTVARDAEGVADARGQNAEQFVTGRQIEIAAEDYGNVGGNFLHFAGEPLKLFPLMDSIFSLFAPAIRRPQIRANAIRFQTNAEHLDDQTRGQFDARVAEGRALGVAGSNHREFAA